MSECVACVLGGGSSPAGDGDPNRAGCSTGMDGIVDRPVGITAKGGSALSEEHNEKQRLLAEERYWSGEPYQGVFRYVGRNFKVGRSALKS